MGVVRRTGVLAGLALCVLVARAAGATEEAQLQSALRDGLQSASSRGANGELDDAARRFYEARGFVPVWLSRDGESVSKRADELVRVLRRSTDDGLNPQAYAPEPLARAVEDARAGSSIQGDVAKQVALELSLTRAFLKLARDLHDGRVAPKSVGWGISPDVFDPAGALALAIDRGDLEAGLSLARPSAPEYAKLRNALLGLRAIQAAGGWPTVSAGRVLVPGVEDDRVLEVRARLRATGELPPPAPGVTLDSERRYDDPVKSAVEEFQRRHGLFADGKVAKQTLTAMNVPVADRIAQVERTMERWRWVPHDRGERFVQVNAAAMDLDAYEQHGGKKVLHSLIVVGQADPKWHTPVLADVIDGVDVNPTWFVPPKIVREDVVPFAQEKPGALGRMGIQIVDRTTGETVDDRAIQWSPEVAERYSLRQPAGPENPLGGTRVVMHNKKGVYLHGTPATWAFQLPIRALSHGCIRVEKITELTNWMIADAAKIAEYARAASSHELTRIDFQPGVPVYLGYFTVFVDDAGALEFRPDLYGADAQLKRALKSSTSAEPNVEVSLSSRRR